MANVVLSKFYGNMAKIKSIKDHVQTLFAP